ncbi:MAG: phosphatase PAP2 family protein [Gemmatimonadota bacterium]|nr:phosphatase PAP2 family protein [Gemmatimonadota bacterium]
MNFPGLLRRAIGACLLGSIIVPAARAQVAAPTDTSRRQQTLFTAADGFLAAGFVGVTVAMFPIDRHIANHLHDPTTPTNRFLDRAANGVEVITSPGAFLIGPALYLYGRAADHPGVEDLGWHGTEAALIGSGVTGILKGLLGRSRPYVSLDTNPKDFKFLKGFSSSTRQSFPSGHTTTAFAVASSVTSEVQRMWPQYTWYAAPVLYGGATLVGLSRMYHNVHWASDVVLGAGVGTFAGLKVVRYSHSHPDNLIDRAILKTSIMPDGHGGGVLAWTVPVP